MYTVVFLVRSLNTFLFCAALFLPGCHAEYILATILFYSLYSWLINDKKHLKNVEPIHYCKPPHAHSPDVASGTVARRLRIDVHDANDNDDNDNA